MLLHWGTEYLERVLPEHLRARIKEPRVDPHYDMVDPIPYINGETGEVMSRVPTEVITRVSRKRLRRFLSEGEDLNIKVRSHTTRNLPVYASTDPYSQQYSKILRALRVQEDIMTVDFEDGSSEQGHMVIGCDGSRSKVRRFLVGIEAAQQEDTGITMINYAAAGCYTPEQARLLRMHHPIVKLCLHPQVNGAVLLAGRRTPEQDVGLIDGWLTSRQLLTFQIPTIPKAGSSRITPAGMVHPMHKILKIRM